MANLFLALILISIIILVAGTSADVRFTYTDTLKITVDFLFFSLILYTDRRRNKGTKNDIFKRIKESVKKTKARRSALDFLLKNSNLTVHSINISLLEKEPAALVNTRANISSLILIIFTYLSLKVQKFSLEKDDFFLISDNIQIKEPTLDFTLKTTVYILLSAIVIYLTKIKSKAERSVKNNVRNKNE